MTDQNQDSRAQNPSNSNPSQTTDQNKAHSDFKQQGQQGDQTSKKDVQGSDKQADQNSD